MIYGHSLYYQIAELVLFSMRGHVMQPFVRKLENNATTFIVVNL